MADFIPLKLDRVRSYARRAAWYDEEGESTFNPFKKIRAERRRKRSKDLEDGLTCANPGGTCLSSIVEKKLESPQKKKGRTICIWIFILICAFLFTWSTGISRNSEAGSHDKDAPTLAGSEDAINVSNNSDGPDAATRMRKTRSNTSQTPRESDSASARNSTVDGPKFTVGNQLRSTIFNSWINILLILVPVGSMFWCSPFKMLKIHR